VTRCDVRHVQAHPGARTNAGAVHSEPLRARGVTGGGGLRGVVTHRVGSESKCLRSCARNASSTALAPPPSQHDAMRVEGTCCATRTAWELVWGVLRDVPQHPYRHAGTTLAAMPRVYPF
jgi:hypothetical protein